MKNLLIILLLFTGAAYGQTITYTPQTAAGYQFKYVKTDSGFNVPFKDTAIGRGTTRPGAIVCYTGDSLLYRWNGLKWILLGDPASVCLSGFTGQIIWVTGLVFQSTLIDYYINCRHYTAVASTLTLDAAYVSADRTDVIYVDTLGNIGILKGGMGGLKPNVDPASQLEIASVDIGAGAITPTGFYNTDVYKENVEWTLSGDATGLSGDTTQNPYAGSKSTWVTSFTNGMYLQYVGATMNLPDITYLKFYIRLNTAFNASTYLSVKFQEGAAKRTNYISITNGNYGFNSSTVGSYQLIIIPMSNFAYSTPTFDGLYFNLSGASAGSFQMDNVQLQQGGSTGSGGGILSVNGDTGPHVTFQYGRFLTLNSDSTQYYLEDINGNIIDSASTLLSRLYSDTCLVKTDTTINGKAAIYLSLNPYCMGGGSGLVDSVKASLDSLYIFVYNHDATIDSFTYVGDGSGGSSGITSLNSLTGATQTFATGTSGTDFAISSASTTHTFNLPTVSGSNRGAVTSALYNTWNAKQDAITTTDSILVYSASNVFAFPSVPATYSDYLVFRNSVLLDSVTDYTTSGNNITILLYDLVAGDKIRFHRTK